LSSECEKKVAFRLLILSIVRSPSVSAFSDYIEEISVQACGPEKLYAFFRYCFRPDQSYFVSDDAEELNTLWKEKEY
jgi:hypothetical protein